MNVTFYIAAAVAIVATFMMVTRFNTVHALLYLVVSLLAVALVFFLLGAPLVAALEVIIYAGAIIVLFVFVVMMLNLGPQAAADEKTWLKPSSWIGPGILCLVLASEDEYIIARGGASGPSNVEIPPEKVGYALFTT
jgi:NADH-quinone oxidoreductase subunit J